MNEMDLSRAILTETVTMIKVSQNKTPLWSKMLVVKAEVTCTITANTSVGHSYEIAKFPMKANWKLD